MPLSRPWYSDGNYAAVDTARIGQNSMWALKCFMKGTIGAVDGRGLWTVEGSSNGVTAGMDAVDRWGDTFVFGNMPWAAIGAARAWIVMKSPAIMGPYYLLIDGTANTDGSTAWVMMWASKVAFTGGTITARPTSTKEWAVHSPASVSPLRHQIWDGIVAGHNFHYTADASGSFWYHDSRNATSIFHYTMAFQVLTETHTGDTQNGFTITTFRTAARGSMEGSSGFFVNSSPAEGRIGGRTPSDSASSLAVQELMMTLPSCGSSWVNQTVANAADGKFDAFPVYIGGTVAFGAGLRGRLPDCSFVGGSTQGNGAPVGSSQPSSGSQEQMVVGNLLVPSSVAPNL